MGNEKFCQNGKICTKEEFRKLRPKLRAEGKRVALCHGVFDLLHYGHIEHLQEAKAQADVLVVSVTAAKYVNKGPGRPYFSDQQRLSFLASIECVDYVLLSEAVTVHDIVRAVQPDLYVKGQEYADAANDVTGNIGPERELVEQYGGRIYFTQGAVYSSTRLLNNFFGALSDAVAEESRRIRMEHGEDVAVRIRRMVDGFADLRILVVGDIILDEYVFCQMQGLTMKDNVMSTRYDLMERYMGGALAIARHLANFAGHVALLSMMGPDRELPGAILEAMPEVECRIVQEPHFVTPVKRRYLKSNPLRQEYDKLFSVNRLLSGEEARRVDYGNLRRNLADMLPAYDIVVVCDYGHGLLDEASVRRIEEGARFLAVNCQTNSANYGLNLITKYRRADAFVVDERELRLAFRQAAGSVDSLLLRLAEQLRSSYAWVTLGADGALGCHGGRTRQTPAATLHVKDTVGAGDAFYALALLCAAVRAPLDLATLLANIAGAIKANIVGNKKPVAKADLLKFVGTVLNV